jgi:hypothetical protein
MVKMQKIKWRKAKKFYSIIDLYWQIGLKEMMIEKTLDFQENVYCNRNTLYKIWYKLLNVYSNYDIIEDKKIYDNRKYKKKRGSKDTISISQLLVVEEDYKVHKPKIDNELKDGYLKIVY